MKSSNINLPSNVTIFVDADDVLWPAISSTIRLVIESTFGLSNKVLIDILYIKQIN